MKWIKVRVAQPDKMFWYAGSLAKVCIKGDQTAKLPFDPQVKRAVGLGILEIVTEQEKEPQDAGDLKEGTLRGRASATGKR